MPHSFDPWDKIARLSRAEIRYLQNRKLHRFLNEQLYPFSLHYKKLFDDNKIDPRKIRTAADLKHLPFTSKAEFVDTPQAGEKVREFILQPDAAKIKKALGLRFTKGSLDAFAECARSLSPRRPPGGPR